MTNEVDEQVELFWRKPYFSTGNPHHASLKVNAEVSFFKQRTLLVWLRGTTQGSSNSSEQFCHTKRFRHIIVCPCVKGFYFGSFIASDRKHNDGNTGNHPQSLTKFEAIHVGHREI